MFDFIRNAKKRFRGHSTIDVIHDKYVESKLGEDGLYTVTLQDTDGSHMDIEVYAESEDEAVDKAIRKLVRHRASNKEDERKSLWSHFLYTPFNENGRENMYRAGGYKPGTLLQKSASAMVSQIQQSNSEPSSAPKETVQRNWYIFVLINMCFFPIGLTFIAVGNTESVIAASTLGIINKFSVSGAVCLFIFFAGMVRAASDKKKVFE